MLLIYMEIVCDIPGNSVNFSRKEHIFLLKLNYNRFWNMGVLEGKENRNVDGASFYMAAISDQATSIVRRHQ